MRSRVAIVAALARELHPLVQEWKLERSEPGVTVYSSPVAVGVVAGMGAARARMAAEAAMRFGPVHRIVSAGWSGSLHAGFAAGEAATIGAVVDAASGEIFPAEIFDDGRQAGNIQAGNRQRGAMLVSMPRVASVEDKRSLRERFGADLVDMEAAAVARFAGERKIPFSAIKAVSDGPDFDLPAMAGFVTAEGGFRERAFGAYVALRPGLWKPMMRLARDSATAARALSSAIELYLAGEIESMVEEQTR